MKRTILATSLLFFLPLFASSQQNEGKVKSSTQPWKVYADSNFTIDYPGDWEENTSGELGTRFILFSPIESLDDQFRENVNLLKQNLEGLNLDLDAYVQLSEEQVKTLLTNSEILKSERRNNENGEHHTLVYYGTQGVLDLRYEQYCWVTDNMAYILTYVCEKDKYAAFKKLSKRILKSFKVRA